MKFGLEKKSVDPSSLLELAWGVFLFSMVYFFAVTFIPIPKTGEDNAKYIVGFLVGTGVGSVISFYFRRGNLPEGDEPKRVPNSRATDNPKE